jgi:pyridoxal phosphate enzyme (YggS family)
LALANETRKAELTQNLAKIKAEIPSQVHLIVVTKTFPLSDVEILHQIGVAEFGENRDQEGKLKALVVPGKWHFQGQLQSNKLKSICRWADVIQTIDSIRYVELVAKATRQNSAEKSIEVFIQVSLDSEGSKENRAGADPSEINQIADAILASDNLQLQGLMAVAPLNEEPESAFSRLAKIHSDFKAKYPNSPFLSAGMSGDFKIAIAHGATHVRIGSQILGSRAPQL